MADVTHASLTGADLHEPKGVSTASNNEIAQASGGAVVWSADISPDSVTLSDTVWDDEKVSAYIARRGGVNDPDWVQFTDDGSGSTGIYLPHFSPSVEEELFFEVQFSHRYKQETDIKPHIHWAPTSTNTGDVVWGIEYVWKNVDGTFGNSTLITVTDAADGTSKKHQVSAFSAITGTGYTESSILFGRLYRKAADASDTYTGDAAFLSVDFHYEVEKMGSDTEYPT